MNTRAVLAAFGLTGMLATLPSHASDMRFTGTAKADDGAVLYTERHQVAGHCEGDLFRPVKHEVAYLEPDSDQPFATKNLGYKTSVIRPTVEFAQPDFNERMEIRYPQPQQLSIRWNTPGSGDDIENFSVAFTDKTVVDAGFDNFVRQNWEAVLAGKSIEFRFLAPTRGEHYAFVLEPVENREIEAKHVLQIRPTGMVLRFLVDPIVLGYNENGALTDYLGLTNIRKNADENYTAHIRYSVETYPDCELTP